MQLNIAYLFFRIFTYEEEPVNTASLPHHNTKIPLFCCLSGCSITRNLFCCSSEYFIVLEVKLTFFLSAHIFVMLCSMMFSNLEKLLSTHQIQLKIQFSR